MIPPHLPPVIVYLPISMTALRCAVSIGTEEYCNVKSKHISENVYILYCAEDVLVGLDANRRVGKEIVFGTFYIVATDHTFLPISLTDTQIDVYRERYAMPERFSDTEIIESRMDCLLQDLEALA